MTNRQVFLPNTAAAAMGGPVPKVPLRQTLAIRDWLPEQLGNGQHGHWSTRQKKLKAAQTTVWAYAQKAGLQPVTGRARLTITLVFAQYRRRDTDNLYSRVKGVVDGLVHGGWIQDDSTDVLELRVQSRVELGVKETWLTLESVA